MEIIYSDDEDDIIERIYFLCDLTENTDKTPEISLEELLKSEENTLEDENLIEDEKHFSIVKDEILGEKNIKLLELAIKEKIPQRYIFYDSDDNLVNLKKILTGKDIIEGLEYIIKNFFKISINNYLYIYTIANYQNRNELIIDDLNKLKNISDIEFNITRLKEYKREIDITIQENIKSMEEKLKRVKDFFSKINDLEYSNQPEDIDRTLELDETEIEFFIRDGQYLLDIESGSLIFDNLRNINNVPLIIYNSDSNTFYKIAEDTSDILDVMDYNYSLEDKKINHIYMFIRIKEKDVSRVRVMDIDLENSKIKFSYPGNTIKQFKDSLIRIIPDIVFVYEKKLSINGSFEIDFEGYDEFRLRYLCLMDDVVSNFLYVKENSIPRSLRKSIRFFFKTYEESNSFSDHSVFFGMDKIHSNRYLLTFKSKIIQKDSINNFILILSKLITYYKEYDFEDPFVEIIETRYTGPDGIGLGGEKHSVEEEYLKINSKKLDILIKQAPDMFPANVYGKSCPCSRQPIIVDEKDIDDWEKYSPPGREKKRDVVLFPPAKSKQKVKKLNFVCPENSYPYLYFIKNPNFGSKYPILPCCGIVKNKEYINDYDLIRKDEIEYMAKKNERRVRKEKKLKTFKILSPGQIGVLPQDILDFFKNIKEGEYVRRGVIQNNTSSLIHCVLTASSHIENFYDKIDKRNKEELEKVKNLINLRKNYLTRSIREKENIVNNFRKIITSFAHLQITSQETYQYDIRQIETFVQDKEKIFNSDIYYRLLEQIFMVNIFVFSYENGNVELEKPRHVYYHIRKFNMYFPSLFIFKHVSPRTIPTYELIEDEKSYNSPYLRDIKFLEYMKNFIRTKNYSVAIPRELGFDMVKNRYSGVNWDMILKDYRILSQDINDSGRMIKINISIGKGEKMSLFVKPSPPLNVKISKMIYDVDKETIVDIFGDQFIFGSEGLWYSLKEINYGVFIPCRKIKSSDKKQKCLEYELSKTFYSQNQKINRVSVIKKNANILKQLIVWLWSLSTEDVDDWFTLYTLPMSEDKLVDLINSVSFRVEYRFPLDIKTVEQGISYLENYIPYIFNSDKIFLYPELKDHLVRYLKFFVKNTEGFPRKSPKSIINLFNGEKDFKKYIDTRLIIGNDKYNQYYNGVKNIKIDIENISDEKSFNTSVFPYKSGDSYFLIQNNVTGRQNEAIFGCYIWKKYGINLGYTLDRTKIWDFFETYPLLLEVFNYTKQDIINYSNKETPLDTTVYSEALYFLSKNNISVPDDKFQMNTSVKYRNSEGYYDNLVDSDILVDIWVYGNGVYSSMLQIGQK